MHPAIRIHAARLRARRAASVALACALPALRAVAGEAPAHAPQSQPLEQIEVNATLDGENLSGLPQGASVVDEDTLRTAGVQHFGDLLGLVPGLTAAGGSSRPRYFQLRGVGETEQYQGAPNPSVGFLIDDIDFSGVAMPATLFDLDRAEVLRGPSGTVYGANALAGLISLHSRDPGREFELRGEATAGDYGTRAAAVAVGDGREDGTAGWRVSAQRYRSDGFIRNAYLGRDDTNGRDEASVRGKLHLAVGDALDLRLALLYADIDNGYDAWTFDGGRTTYSDQPGRDAQRSSGASLRAEWRLPAGTLLSVTSGAVTHGVYSFDADWGNDAYWGVNGPYDYFERHVRERHTLAEDLRYTADAPLFGGWKPVLGAYLLSLREADDQLDTWNDAYNGAGQSLLSSDYRAVNSAAYASLQRATGAHGTLEVGLRGERRGSDYRDTAEAPFPHVADDMVGGNVSWRWRPAARTARYVLLSRGYKAGGYNIGQQVDAARRRFRPEALWNLEVGQRSTSAGGRFDYQVDAYAMRRQSMQVYTSVQLDPTNPATYVYYTDNAAAGDNVGVEGEWRWRPAPRWQFGGSGALQRTRFIGGGGLAPDGRAQPYAPGWQLAASVDYEHPAGAYARFDLTAQDGFYFSASHDQRAAARLLLNLRLGWRAGAWNASAWVRNLLDRRYSQHGFYFGLEPPDYAAKLYLQQGDPRQVGVTLGYDLGR
jgi:outer membrane receptor protein involved in Fe transport